MTQIKTIIVGLVVLVVLLIIGLIYWRGSSNASTKNDLRVARETIQSEREALVISHIIDMRVNAESIQTVKNAQEATREIEQIRERDVYTRATDDGEVRADGVATDCDSSCARVLQLAREARAAALASSAKLQSARAGN